MPLPSDMPIDLPLARRSKDPRPPNIQGQSVLDLCKTCNMRILNGRTLGDLTGKFTCYEHNSITPSVIDYALVDDILLSQINHFSVGDFTNYSDHCSLEFSLKLPKHIPHASAQNKVRLKQAPGRYKWSKAHKDKFQEVICSLESKTMFQKLKEKLYTLDITGINESIQDFNSNIYMLADKTSVPLKKLKKHQRKKNQYPRYIDKTCIQRIKEIKYICKKIKRQPFAIKP